MSFFKSPDFGKGFQVADMTIDMRRGRAIVLVRQNRSIVVQRASRDIVLESRK